MWHLGNAACESAKIYKRVIPLPRRLTQLPARGEVLGHRSVRTVPLVFALNDLIEGNPIDWRSFADKRGSSDPNSRSAANHFMSLELDVTLHAVSLVGTLDHRLWADEPLLGRSGGF